MSGKPRRSRFEAYRDLLLALQSSDGKLTHLMTWTGLNYISIKKALEEMIIRKLIRQVNVEGDGRSDYRFEITEKGRYVSLLACELFDYFEETGAEADPLSEPPVWLVRKLVAMKGYSLERPRVVEALPLLEEASERIEVEDPEVIPPSPAGWFQCPYCPKQIPSERGLKIHIGQMHKEKRGEAPSEKL